MIVREKGFTLIELLVVIALVAIIVSLAGPSYNVLVVDTRNSGQVNSIQGLISFARSEAVKAQDTVTVCSPNPATTACIDSDSWSNGWMIFLDRDADRTVDVDDFVLKVGEAQQAGDTIKVTGMNLAIDGLIQFSSTGEIQGGGATAGSVVICPRDNDDLKARAVVVYLSGFSRLAVDENDNDIVNGHDGGDVTCP